MVIVSFVLSAAAAVLVSRCREVMMIVADFVKPQQECRPQVAVGSHAARTDGLNFVSSISVIVVMTL